MQTDEFSGNLQEIFRKFHHQINRSRLLQTTETLWRTEFSQTFNCYHASARLAENFLKEAGCQSVERIAFPADGKTVFQDKTMPLGWHASMGRLEIVHPAEKSMLLADYKRHPFHLIKGSVATPPEGITTRLICEEAVRAGEDAQGALVLSNSDARPTYRHLLDAGILGIVTDNLIARHDTPDAIQWVNACTEGFNWHTRADEQPRISFSISPRTGDQLRALLKESELLVRVFSDGKRCEDKIEAVTGLLPGEDEREIWLLAHLYEPLANDNSSGVACALEIVHALQVLCPRPRFTLRVVFAMEAYGFAAYAEHLGGHLRERALCAVNLDALPILSSDRLVEIGLSQSGSPSSADFLMETLLHLAEGVDVASIQTEGTYADDRLLGDSTIGLPTLWFTRAPQARTERATGQYLWHNSAQDMTCIGHDAFHHVTALYGTWTAALLSTDEAEVERRLPTALNISRNRLKNEAALLNEKSDNPTSAQELAKWLDYRLEIESARIEDFVRFGGNLQSIQHAIRYLAQTHQQLKKDVTTSIEGPSCEAWKLAETLVVVRKTRGLPRDLAAVPKEHRNRLLEIPITFVLAHANGHRTVAELFRRVQWELRTFFSPSQIMDYIESLRFLAKYGYIDILHI